MVARGIDQSEREQVRRAEHAVRTRFERGQPVRGRDARRIGVGGRIEQRDGRQAVLLRRTREFGMPRERAVAGLDRPDEREPARPRTRQQPGGERRAGRVVADDHVGARQVRRAVDHRDRDLVVEILAREPQRRRGRGHHDARDPVAEQHLERLLDLARVLGVHHERRQRIAAERGEDVCEQLGAKRILEAGRDDADHAAALRDHVARDQVDLVAERARGAHHALAGRGRDARGRREGAGDGGTGDAGAQRDVGGGDPVLVRFVSHARSKGRGPARVGGARAASHDTAARQAPRGRTREVSIDPSGRRVPARRSALPLPAIFHDPLPDRCFLAAVRLDGGARRQPGAPDAHLSRQS